MLIFFIILSGLAVLSLFLIVMLISYILNHLYNSKHKLPQQLKIVHKNTITSLKETIESSWICELCGSLIQKSSVECPYCKNKI